MSEQDFSGLKHLSFEEAYAKLEKIVEQLETNSLPLDDSVSLFEEGQQLSAYCQQLLDKSELRVNKLLNGNIVKADKSEEETAKKEASKPAEASDDSDEDAIEAKVKIDNPAQST